ncbi:hypothetical protein [Nocardia stercoris]|uniref:hypothetical protein n=1 Tax=Nocardia stercoris TaxID=2483361 RepID=UPI0018F2E83D|nr:hypothetical protein [Nocardia stercoris]
MSSVFGVAAIVVVLMIVLAALSIRIVTQYERGVLFRLGRVVAVRSPGLNVIVPVVDRLPGRHPRRVRGLRSDGSIARQ